MIGGRMPVALLAAALVLIAACSREDGPIADVDDPPVDTGVTFPGSVTGPGEPSGGSSSSTTVDRTLTVSDGAPRGFPGDFPRPADADMVVGSAVAADAGRVLAVDLTTTDRVAEVVAFYRAAIDDAGFVLLFDDADNLRFETDEYVGDVLVTAADGSTAIVLTATLPDG